jgi:hypothetical protein
MSNSRGEVARAKLAAKLAAKKLQESPEDDELFFAKLEAETALKKANTRHQLESNKYDLMRIYDDSKSDKLQIQHNAQVHSVCVCVCVSDGHICYDEHT